MSQRERISNVIGEYDAQGIHRTATTTDEASAHWLADHVRAAGLEPRLEGYDVHRLDPGECFLELDGRRIEGVPLFDCTYTDVDAFLASFARRRCRGKLRWSKWNGTISLRTFVR